MLALESGGREHELVLAEAVVAQLVDVLQPAQEVIGVEHGRLGHLLQSRAVDADEGIGLDEHAERPEKAAHPPDRLRQL